MLFFLLLKQGTEGTYTGRLLCARGSCEENAIRKLFSFLSNFGMHVKNGGYIDPFFIARATAPSLEIQLAQKISLLVMRMLKRSVVYFLCCGDYKRTVSEGTRSCDDECRGHVVCDRGLES